MLGILDGILVVFDLATFVADLALLPSAVRDALKDPLRSVLWLASASTAGVALAVWQERTGLWLAAGLTVCAVGTCALAIWLPALRRRRRVTEV